MSESPKSSDHGGQTLVRLVSRAAHTNTTYEVVDESNDNPVDFAKKVAVKARET